MLTMDIINKCICFRINPHLLLPSKLFCQKKGLTSAGISV